MTSQSPTMATSTTSTVDDDTDNSYSTASRTASPDTQPLFSHFNDLPPELRHQIWRFAVPSPGINFFNVHSFPMDHEGCCRSVSPPWVYLDLRRLDIEDDDDEVFRYDPSTWQARDAVRQSCHEARLICSIPESKAAAITLTRPRRGLFVRAGDGQLRNTPLRIGSNDVGVFFIEPVVRRTVQVHVDEMLCLSVENCSFNLPYEETPLFPDDDGVVEGLIIENDFDDGWAYDPQLTPELPRTIPASLLCASMGRCSLGSLRCSADALRGLLYGHIPEYQDPNPSEMWSTRVRLGRLLLMFDALTQAIGERNLDELTSDLVVLWDRFGDCYVRLPWRRGSLDHPDSLPITYRLTKIWPETNNIRERYVRSALLRSPKRPAPSS
ncbi:hypothetical protein E0Z10_g6248 [Xylaria hypoxylon]|uniref:2EXR domain-containing protein n=1 Tax=Xylaria hypoxylon TaxID=37992 RepID=A0A4Z0YE57_9PEZI|nr:hypothetical protein E0Z10_g6248 [Xylaria hypoxylon]